MTTELFYLFLTAILTGFLWIPVVIGYVLARGPLKPSDYKVAPTSALPDWVNRANRAHVNAVENFAPFAAVVLIAHAAGVSTSITAISAAVYFYARLVHAALHKGCVMVKSAALLVLMALSLASHAADVFRWVDENGKVHYGDAVPERYKQKATKIDSAGPRVTSAQRQEAEARLAREKAAVESMSKARENDSSGPQPASAAARESKRAGGNAGCPEQMKKYHESLACFDAYRNASGGIKAEAFQKCSEVKQPAGCLTNPSPSDRTAQPAPSEPKYDIPTQPR